MNHVEKTFILVACDATTHERQSLSEVIKGVFEHRCSPEDFSLSLQAKAPDQPDNPAEIAAAKAAIDSSESASTSPTPLENGSALMDTNLDEKSDDL
jgi:hypothetical protein